METIVIQLDKGLDLFFVVNVLDEIEISSSDHSDSENEINFYDEKEEEEFEEILDEEIGEWMQIEQHLDIEGGLHGHSCVLWKGSLYIYGGANHGWARNDMFRFDLKTKQWEQLFPTGTPLPVCSDHSAIIYEDNMIIFGGRGHASRRNGIPSGIKQPLYNDVYFYNFETNSVQIIAVNGEPPKQRKAHTCVLYNDRMYIFAGWDNITPTKDMFYLDLKATPPTWVQVEQLGDIPAPRFEHSAVVYRDKMIIWAGSTGFNPRTERVEHYRELVEFDFKTNTWKTIPKEEVKGRAPKGSEGHRTFVIGSKMYVTGGHNGDDFFGDLHSFDFETKIWSKVKSFGNPRLRACFTMQILDNSQVLLLGGFGPKEPHEHDNDIRDPGYDTFHRYKDMHIISLSKKSNVNENSKEEEVKKSSE